MTIRDGVLPWSEAIKVANENERLAIEAQRTYNERSAKLAAPKSDRYVELVRSGRLGHPGKTHFQQQKDRV
jgi:hypothetical protein